LQAKTEMIPISTDAPIYHYPVVTVTMIVVNVVCFVAFCLNADSESVEYFDSQGNPVAAEEVERAFVTRYETNPDEAYAYLESLEARDSESGAIHWLSLQFGRIRPWQWMTNNFMHADWGHLIGNMFFLWAFGIVVEGKVGSLAFLAIYLGIGTAYGMLLQVGSYFFIDTGIALGASAVIFGLLAICVVWAPANEFSCIIFYSVRDISILVFAGFFVAKELFFLFAGGFSMSSQLLHVLGFVVGFPLGVFLLHTGRVDCEGWDLFSYFEGNTGNSSRYLISRRKAKRRKTRDTSPTANNHPLSPAVSADKLQDQVGEAIGNRQFELAIRLQTQLMKSHSGLAWRQPDLYRIVDGLLREQKYDIVIPLMRTYLQTFTEKRFAMQVALMKTWLARKQPKEVLQLLETIDASTLSSAEQQQLEKLRAMATKAKAT
jgi:membrane associated rhomboid family serine protease